MAWRRKAVTLLVQEGPDWEMAQASWYQVVLRVVWEKKRSLLGGWPNRGGHSHRESLRKALWMQEFRVREPWEPTLWVWIWSSIRIFHHLERVLGKGYFKEWFKWMITELAWSCHPEDGRDLEQGGQLHEQIPLHHCASPSRSLQWDKGGSFGQDQCCPAFKYNPFSVGAFSLKSLSEAGGVCHLGMNSSKALMTLVDITVQSLLS